jgi:hypothetical protein
MATDDFSRARLDSMIRSKRHRRQHLRTRIALGVWSKAARDERRGLWIHTESMPRWERRHR